MKTYKKIMNAVTMVENLILALSMLLVLVLTFGNVVARKVFQHSWGFTEEITVAVFVLISMLAAGVAARTDGELVSLSLVPDRVKPETQKVLKVISTILCLIYSLVLTYQAIGRMVADKTQSPILHISKSFFWFFVVLGGVSLMLHFIENIVDYLNKEKTEKGGAAE